MRKEVGEVWQTDETILQIEQRLKLLAKVRPLKLTVYILLILSFQFKKDAWLYKYEDIQKGKVFIS